MSERGDHGVSDAQLDAALRAVALGDERPFDLRARVLAGVDAARHTRRRRLLGVDVGLVARPAFGVAVLGLAALAVFGVWSVDRRDRASPPAGQGAATSAPDLSGAIDTPNTAGAERGGEKPVAASRRHDRDRETSRVAAIRARVRQPPVPESRPDVLPPLDLPEPLAVEPIEEPPIGVARLEVERLSIDPLDVDRLEGSREE